MAKKFKSQWKIVSIDSIHPDPKNPRIIKDDDFKDLVKSIQSFTEMLEIRPIVIDEKNKIIGGEKRYLAAKVAGLKRIPIVLASNLTPSQKKEFMIKDNVHSGLWDFDTLNTWDNNKLSEWGVDIPKFVITTKSKSKAISGYKKVHILISLKPDDFNKILKHLEAIRKITGVEYEQSSN